ncbi:hypothetical protein J8I26_06455 [Herbaspirillum sp. LeCh32-8]|uniref:hypothetical protein n=1 Tax=Herbaspirillum sp. LeCh32-8 TaxID=2821356 RepID=UPI001AEB15C3|nr:hypothetical protein [Herbaspirillum sp. LeCh32-8]MBP0597734.1 hypothetical protein [Herbaspirillum sp. LeCh32-8]
MNKDLSAQDFELLKGELVIALGEAVWAFSLVEKQSYFYIKAFSELPMLQILAGQSFGARVKAIGYLVQAGSCEDYHRNKIKKLFEDALKLAKRRNVLVHSPWSIWIDPRSTELRDHVQDAKQLENVNLESVRSFATEARELAELLALALAEVRKWNYPENEPKVLR